MSASTIPVIKFLFNDEFRTLNEALRLNPDLKVENFKSPNDLVAFLSKTPAGLVITSVCNKEDIVHLATFMKIVKKVTKDTAVKVVVLNFTNEPSYEKAILQLGIQDLIETNVNTKALKFKIDFWIKSLNVQAKDKTSLNPRKFPKTQENENNGKDRNPDVTLPDWIDPVELEDDIWIIKNLNDAKKILGKWLIRMLGPSPSIGQWTELRSGLWRFNIKPSEKDLLVPNEGSWYYAGEQKPEFVWKDNLWLFTGQNFDLFFRDSKTVVSRFKTKEKFLIISQNSLYAKTKEQIIIESFDKELVFKREAEKLEDLEGKSKTEQILSGNLEGRHKNQQIDYSHLQGKTKAGTDHIEDLYGNTKSEAPIPGHLEGKSRPSSHQNGHLRGETEGHVADGKLLEAPVNNIHQKYYEGHNKTEFKEKAMDELSVKSEKEKFHQGQKAPLSFENEAAGDLFGKSYTDKLSSHYSNPGDRSERDREAKKQDEVIRKVEKKPSNLNASGILSGKDSTLDRKVSEREEQATHDRSKRLQLGRATSQNSAKSSKELFDEIYSWDKKSQQNKYQEKDIHERSLKNKRNLESDRISEEENKLKESKNIGKLISRDGTIKLDEKQSPIDESLIHAKGPDQSTESASAAAFNDFGLDELTRDSRVISYLKFQEKKISCELNDFFDDSIIFSTNEPGIYTATNVRMQLAFKFLAKDKNLSLDGKVTKIDDDGNGNKFLVVHLSHENIKAFDSFMQLYNIRQTNINEFIKKAQGLD